MSWYFSIVGEASAVKAVANEQQYLPQPLKDTVALFADALLKRPVATAMQVSSSGHYDPVNGGNVASFTLNEVVLATVPEKGTVPENMPPSS